MGGAYSGWQVQNNAPSVQGTLTRACSDLTGAPCLVTGCSRTDAGVHARGFRATVEPEGGGSFPATLTAGRFPSAVNTLLPPDISVLRAEPVPDGFHPRYSATGKTYKYMIADGPQRDPLFEGRAYQPRRELSTETVALMDSAAARFAGRRDFASFMASGSSVRDTVRTVTEFSCRREGKLVVITASADGFLYNMVRIMAGTLLMIGLNGLPPETAGDVIAARSRDAAGPTLPAHGLYLWEVTYPDLRPEEDG